MFVELNSEQRQAIQEIKAWWETSERFFILHGRAGTGKTLITRQVIEQLPNCKPLFTAPTNAAVKQLSLVLPKFYDLKTTHSALGFYFSFKEEKSFLTRSGVPGFLSEYNLLVIDEASFIGDIKSCKSPNGEMISLFDAIIETDLKVLFIGHKSQLPEVDESNSLTSSCESVVFQQNWPITTLTKVERHSGNLQDYICSLEDLIYVKEKKFKNKYPMTKIEQIKFLSSAEGKESFLADKCKVIAYRNKKVDAVNMEIRSKMFGPKVPIFIPNDRLMIIKPVAYIGNINQLSETQISKHLKNKNKILISANSSVLVQEIKNAVVLGIDCWQLNSIIDEEVYQLYVPKDKEKFKEFSVNLKKFAFAQATPFLKEKAFARYHALVSLFCVEWKYNFALTVHRAQGKNIQTIIVDWDDIQWCRHEKLRYKLLYVGASRVIDNLRIIG